MTQKVSKRLQKCKNTKSSKIFQNIPKYSKMFQSNLGQYKEFQKSQKRPENVKNLQMADEKGEEEGEKSDF